MTMTMANLAEMDADDLLTLSEVAEILRQSESTLRWWRQQGTGPRFFKIGRHLMTTVGCVTEWVRQQMADGPDAA